MKPIPVKDVAKALGISDRGVLYRREKGRLKGVLVKNDRGVDEYRIYPTKEIIEGLRRIGSPLVASDIDYESTDVIDAVSSTIAEDIDITKYDSAYGAGDVVEGVHAEPRANWTEETRANVNGVADELWNNVISRFMEKLEEKDQLIGEMRTELKDKERQLKLLPDLEAQARKAREESDRVAETERKNAELKALEVEALRKQVSALENIKEEATIKVEQAGMQARALEVENERLKEKIEEAVLSTQKLAELEKIVLEMQKPKPGFWQKFFGVQQ